MASAAEETRPVDVIVDESSTLDLNAISISSEETRPPMRLDLPERCVLEQFTQCSKSHLWKLMMSYYDRKGPSAWSSCIVPNFITSNSFIANCYAKVLLGYISDCMQETSSCRLDVNEPLYIVELGAGSGKLSYLLLKALEKSQHICPFPFRKIVYVMTDFTEKNFNFWVQHPALKVIIAVSFTAYVCHSLCRNISKWVCWTQGYSMR